MRAEPKTFRASHSSTEGEIIGRLNISFRKECGNWYSLWSIGTDRELRRG